MKTQHTLAILLLVVSLALAGCGDEGGQADQVFSLRTGLADGRLAFIGVGGAIDGVVNPELAVKAGERVRIELHNGDGVTHDLALPGLGRQTPLVMGKESVTALTFTAEASGVYTYLCSVSGHRQAGMEGRLLVTP